jgi:hypothetical protein
MRIGIVSSINLSLILCNSSQTERALMYPVLLTVINSLLMASIAPETLYLILLEGVGWNWVDLL